MTDLVLPNYTSKAEVYSDLDSVLSYIPREKVYLSHFKTAEFNSEELIHGVIKDSSIRSTVRSLQNYHIPIMPGLRYKLATCIFSENSKTLGLKRHIHLPKTGLPTITIGKKIFKERDDVIFKFFRASAPPDITLSEDFVLRFDSCSFPHSVEVADIYQSVWLFIVFEHCGAVDLAALSKFYNCNLFYNYYE